MPRRNYLRAGPHRAGSGSVTAPSGVGADLSELGSSGLLALAPVALYRASTEGSGRFLEVGESVEALLGFSADELISEPSLWSSRIHPEDMQSVAQVLGEEREHAVLHYRFLHADGLYRWVRDERRRVSGARRRASGERRRVSGERGERGERGEPDVVYGAFSDLSDLEREKEESAAIRLLKAAHRELKASELRYRDLYDNAPDMFATLDADSMCLVECNSTLCMMTGYAREDLLEMQIGDLCHERSESSLKQALFEFVTRGSVKNAEVALVRADQTVFDAVLSISGVHDEDGKVVAGRAVFRDISELVRAKSELEELNATLERRVEHRTRQLTQKMEALNRSNEELEQFAAIASHDLQEPLRMVSSFARLLSTEYDGVLDGTAKEYLGFVTQGAERMRALIHDLLTYARSSSDGLEPERVETQRLVDEMLRSQAHLLKEHGVRVHVDSLPPVFGHPTQLGQLFQNLLSNAVKFRAEDPEIRISATRLGPFVEFSVADNGIGVAPGAATRIFQLFQRLHTDDEYPGTGIGLSICKKIVDAHGGRIRVSQNQPRGAIFCFTLPAEANPRRRAPSRG